jgi:hypothetical protein
MSGLTLRPFLAAVDIFFSATLWRTGFDGLTFCEILCGWVGVCGWVGLWVWVVVCICAWCVCLTTCFWILRRFTSLCPQAKPDHLQRLCSAPGAELYLLFPPHRYRPYFQTGGHYFLTLSELRTAITFRRFKKCVLMGDVGYAKLTVTSLFSFHLVI